MRCNVIAIANNKGGTGKTTCSLNIAAALSTQLDKQVLVIDLDSQANLTAACGIPTDLSKNVGTYMLKRNSFSEIIHHHEMFDILPASKDMAKLEAQIMSEKGRESLLKNRLKRDGVYSNYDFVIIDCPPNLGEYTSNAFVASHSFLVPYQAEYFSFIGTGNLMRYAEEEFVENGLNPDLSLLGIVITRYNRRERNKLKREIVQAVEESGTKLFSTYIRHDSKLIASPMEGKSIFQYAPESNGAQDYLNLTIEILQSYV